MRSGGFCHTNVAKIQFIIYILQAKKPKIYTNLAKINKIATRNPQLCFFTICHTSD